MRSADRWKDSRFTLVQLALAAAIGVLLALAAARMPPLILLGATIVVGFSMFFLQRPDLGLLTVLLVRSSTDLSIVIFGALSASGDTVRAGLLNVGLILTLIIAGGIYILSRGVPVIGLPGGQLFALLLLGGLVGTLRSEAMLLAAGDWLPVLGSLVAYALAAHLHPVQKDVQRVVDVIIASFVVPASVGLYQLVSGSGIVGPGFPIPRVLATFVHPNPFGFYLVLMISLFVCQIPVRTGGRKVFVLACLAVATVLLAATFTRVAWAGALIVLLIVGALRSRIVLLSLPIIAILAIGLFPAIGLRLQDPLGGSLADRMYNLWPATLREWQVATVDTSSFAMAINRLVGLGPGAGQILIGRGYGSVTPPHNDYLRVLVEYGAFGLVLFLTLVVVLGVFAFRTWRAAARVNPQGAAVALTFLTLTVAFPLMSLSDNVFGYTANQLYFWSLAGLTLSVNRMTRRVYTEAVTTDVSVLR